MSETNPVRPVELRSERVLLRAPDDRDIDTIATLCQDPDVQHWTTIPAPYTRDDAVVFVREAVRTGWERGTSCTWGIRFEPAAAGADGTGAERGSGAGRDGDGPAGEDPLVGMVGLDRIQVGGAELGYWLSPAARGAGIMSEAVRLVLDFGFEVLGLQRVVWHAFTGNAPSASVARRAGFRFEGMARLDGVQRGTRLDSWQAGLLATDPRTPAEGWPADTFAAPTV